MLLVIDVGNTNIVFALYENTINKGIWRISTDPLRTADEYQVWLGHLLDRAQIKQARIDEAIIASVVPDVTFNLERFCTKHLNCDPILVDDESVDPGIAIRVDHPEDVGADRLANAVAGHASYDGPLIIIDFGTATTFDIVGADGAFCGGIIAPSARHSIDALHRNAAKLPKVDVARPAKVIGTGTISAMQSGIFWGYVSLIEGLVDRIQQEFGTPMTTIATGGIAPRFAECTNKIQHVDPDLTLRGLVLIYLNNRMTE